MAITPSLKVSTLVVAIFMIQCLILQLHPC
jgi:hypothetical protein